MQEHTQPGPEDSSQEYEPTMAVFYLVQELERFAQSYSDEYAECLEDGCKVTRGSTDLGGLLSTQVTFEANKLRGSFDPFSEVPEAVELAEYNVRSKVRQDGLTYTSLPVTVQEYIQEFDDFADGDYNEYTDVALEYEQSYFVSSDGEFMYENSLSIYLDGDRLSLPDHPSDLEVEKSDSIDLEEEPGRAEGVDTLFAEVFGGEELLSLRAISNQIIAEHQQSHPIYHFYNQMENQRFMPKAYRAHLAGVIVKQLFTDDHLSDA